MTDITLPDNSPPIHDTASLQVALHTLIPISKHMGIQVVDYDGLTLVLEAPLEANINHQQSAFGGSLFSLSALAGWSILQLKLGEMNVSANTVIAGGDVSYSAPVFQTLHCRLSLPDSFSDFQEKLLESGKASIQLTSNILLEDATAMSFTGKYVVRKT